MLYKKSRKMTSNSKTENIVPKKFLRICWRLSTILKTSKKRVKLYIFRKFIKYIIHWDKTQILKMFPSDRINVTKNAHFFLSAAWTITVLLLIRKSYASWSASLLFLKVCVRFSIFDPVLFLSKIIFLFDKRHGFFDIKTLYFLSKLK